jgi:two-component system, NtrC family, nitrogen regulation sensor histidine kinase NtrY
VSSKPTPQKAISSELKLFLLACLALLPVGVLLLMLWWQPALSTLSKLGFSLAAVVAVLAIASAIRNSFVHQLRTLNTLIEAIRKEDYSLRGTLANESGDLAELYQQINLLTQQLQQSRQEEKELRGLLERIVTQLNVAVIAYDEQGRIVLVNHLSEKLLAKSSTELVGTAIQDYQLDQVLPLQSSHVLEHHFAGARGRWQLSHQTYVHNGKTGHLLFIADLELVLSEEEIKAWQRLIRVIAHEVNNSLTPITSLCQTLSSLLLKLPETPQQQDILQGMEVINERAHNLKRFISDYARIARLPDSQKKQFELGSLINRIRTIYHSQQLHISMPAAAIVVFGDQAQLEQVLINLIKNAVEANADVSKPVQVQVTCIAAISSTTTCTIEICDQGPGITNAANLFVPFYTTKPQGAGIGLALSRRIVTAHGGDLQLENRAEGVGAVATLSLPVALLSSPNGV